MTEDILPNSHNSREDLSRLLYKDLNALKNTFMKSGVKVHKVKKTNVKAVSEGSTELPKKYQILGASVQML